MAKHSKIRKRLMDRKIVELLLQGKSQREVMQTLRVGDKRVKRIRSLAVQYGYLLAPGSPVTTQVPLPPYPEALFPDGPDPKGGRSSEVDQELLAKKSWIIDRLEAGWHPITVFEEIGLPVGRSSFYRFLHRHSLYVVGESRRRVVPEIVHQPGEALILDWGKLRDVVVDGKKRVLWAFVGVLGYSRFMMVRLVWSNDVATTLAAIESMFREIGGIPARITSDNPKCFALEADRFEPLLNPAFERFAAYFGTTIECLPPADPEKKGKVERQMPYVRRLYEAHGKGWLGIEESQVYLDRKLELANERKHGTTQMKPIEQLLSVEVQALKPLPSLAYEPEQSSCATVRRDGHARFDHKYYSVDEVHIGKEIMIIANRSRVSMYCDGKLIETHDRIAANDPLRSKSTKPHHLKPWERELQDHSVYRKRAARLGPDVERLVVLILAQGHGFVDTRRIWGVLSLDKKHSAREINEACKKALELGTLSYRAIKSLIKLLPKDTAAVSPCGDRAQDSGPPASNKFVRPMSVYEEQLKLFEETQKPKLVH
jgi:transposase